MNRTKRRQDLKQQVKQSTPKIYNYTEKEFQRRVTICAQDMLEQAKLDAVKKALNYATSATIATLTLAMLDVKGIGINRINQVITKANFTFSCIEANTVSPKDLIKLCEESGVITNSPSLTVVKDIKEPPLKTILIHGYPAEETIQHLNALDLTHRETIYFDGYTITLATDRPMNPISCDYIVQAIYSNENKIPDIRKNKDKEPVFNGILSKPITLTTENPDVDILFMGGVWGCTEEGDELYEK